MATSAATRVLSVLTGFALVVLGILAFPTAGAAEEFEAMHCYAGTFTTFHGSQELKSLSEWTFNGIFRSPNKLFDNVATHCAGVGRAGEGYALCNGRCRWRHHGHRGPLRRPQVHIPVPGRHRQVEGDHG